MHPEWAKAEEQMRRMQTPTSFGECDQADPTGLPLDPDDEGGPSFLDRATGGMTATKEPLIGL